MKLQDKLMQDITLLDGGFGTTVEQFGYDVKHPLWSSNLIKHQPEAVYQVHKAFVDSGADIILTNTYQAAVPSFLNSGLTRDDAVYYLQQAVTLARRAATDQTIVAGSLGPYGAMLGNGAEYTGDYEVTAEDYIHYHQERLDILIAAGITVFAFETIPNLEEIKAIKTLLADYTDIECWLSITLKDSAHLSDGTKLEEACNVVNTIKNVSVFGVNCTSVKVIDAALEGLLRDSKHPLILYPNGGRTYDAEKKIWIDQEDSSLVEAAVRWKEQGVKIIGGCCQVGPEEIGELSDVLKT
ncbi:homocysteine S-methyltransferase [Macrococcus equipercicus]|uniref:Homocysteine S-methyltransferase n=1 Tax=Macrococcus equipercicus TaxID=69967 RepID=A0A9Q9BVW5_9STAP|nr:homocysteine S-methyltransferase [Macrococcus equipercicus]UTH14192.1 homocysteine S-methyltransferase [Macrococcus equipercicus]